MQTKIQQKNRKIAGDFEKQIDCKDKISCFEKIMEKFDKNIAISVFDHKNKKTYQTYISKRTFKKHANLLLIATFKKIELCIDLKFQYIHDK